MPTSTAVAFAVAAAVAVAAAGGAAAQGAPWRDLLTISCDGSVRAFGNHGALATTLRLNALPAAHKYWHDKAVSKAMCHCPAISQSEAEEVAGLDFGSVLRRMEHNSSETPNALDVCDWSATLWDVFGESAQDKFELPATCSSATWASDGTCLVQAAGQLPLDPDADPSGQPDPPTLQLALAKCAGTSMPFVSLTCSGAMCEHFARPCETANGECAGATTGLSCTAPFDFDRDDALDGINEAFNVSHIYAAGGTCPATLAAAADSALDAALDIVGVMLSGSFGSSTLQMCGVGDVLGGSVGDYLGNLLSPCRTEDDWGCTAAMGFTAWDGVMDDSGSAVSAARLDGSAWPAAAAGSETLNDGLPNNRTLLELTCETRLTVLPGLPFEVSLTNPNVHKLIGALQNEVVKPLFDCRTGATDKQFRIYQNVLSPSFWMKVVTTESSADTTPAPSSDTVRTAIPDLKTNDFIDFWAFVIGQDVDGSQSATNANDNKLVMDDVEVTCSISSMDTSRRCAVKWTGMAAATGKDVALTLAVSQCPSDEKRHALPSITVGCAGADCAEVIDVWQTPTCFDDSDCSGGLPCEKIFDAAPFIGETLWDVTGTEDLFFDLGVDFDSITISFGIEGTDDFSVYTEPFESTFLDTLTSLREALGFGTTSNYTVEAALVQSSFECSVSGNSVVEMTIYIESDVNGTLFAAALAEHMASNTDMFEGVTLTATTCTVGTTNSFLRLNSYDKDAGANYFVRVRRCAAAGGPFRFYDFDCDGDECANRDLAEGDMANFFATIGGNPSAASDLSGMGFCRPQWVQNAVDSDIGHDYFAAQVETGAGGNVKILTLEPFSDDDDDDDDSAGVRAGSAATAAVAAGFALFAAVSAV